MEWSKQVVISQLQELHSAGVAINSQYLLKSHPALQMSARRLFGGKFPNALIAAGFDPREISQTTTRSRESLSSEVSAIISRGEPLNSSYVEINYNRLWESASRRFGGWYNFLREEGYDPEGIRLDGTDDSYIGCEFEKILREILETCGGYKSYNSIYENDPSCVPDFIIDEKVWLDAKLSSWTAFHPKCATIEKYTKHCEKLIIVYLRGKDIKHSNPKVELRHVSFYFPDLKKYGRVDLKRKLEELIA